MAGRKRKVVDISTGKIGKQAIKNRQEQEKKLKLGREHLEAPEWLSCEGKEEFERVVTEAGKINLLDNLDLGFLAIYCNAYSCYQDVTEKISCNGYLGKRRTANDVYDTVHPLLVVQEKYIKQIMQCSTKLGLATTDRLKLIVPTKEETKENKFIELIKARKQG